MGVSLSIKIDPLMISLSHGMYARVLVEVDLVRPLQERILVAKEDSNNGNEIEFFVVIEVEKLPKFCDLCIMIGYDYMIYRRTPILIKVQGRRSIMEGTQLLVLM